MAGLMRFLMAQTEQTAAALTRRNQLVSGIVVRVDGSQVLVNIGGQTLGATPTLGLPLLPGDQVWIRRSAGQPQIAGLQSRNGEVA